MSDPPIVNTVPPAEVPLPPVPHARGLHPLAFFVLQALVWVTLALTVALLVEMAGWATWVDALYFSAANWLPWVVIAPGIFWLARRFPFERSRWLRSLPVHVLACAACVLLVVWLSARLAPGRWPVPGRSPFSSEGRAYERVERDSRERAAAAVAASSGSESRRPSATPAPAAPREALLAEGPASAAASETRPPERRSDRWSQTRPPDFGSRRPGERSSGGTGSRPAPDSVPGILRRWAWFGNLWPPFSSTLLRVNFSAAIYVIIASLAHAIGFYRRAQERESQALALTASLNQAKLDALRLQLQPHFLFNALNAISALVHRHPDRAEELIADLSELLRLSLQSTSAEVPLRRELELLDRYLALEQTRLGERLTLWRDIDPAALPARVPPFLLQPIAENAVRHGLEPRPSGGTLTVSARVEGGQLRLVVSDNGVGFKPGVGAPPRGIGLVNAEERLRTLHGDRAHLEVLTPEAGGVRVELTLPFRPAEAPATA